MTRAPVVIAASAPSYCELCRGDRQAGLIGPSGVALPIWCPHCTPAGGLHLPILTLPVRQESPKENP